MSLKDRMNDAAVEAFQQQYSSSYWRRVRTLAIGLTAMSGVGAYIAYNGGLGDVIVELFVAVTCFGALAMFGAHMQLDVAGGDEL